MYRFLLSAVVLLVTATPVRADPGLIDAVAAAYFPRTASADLRAVADERAIEISACARCMNHDRMRPGTAEVLGFNVGFADAVGHVVDQWRASAAHDGILSNTRLGRIGCAERVVAEVHYFACVLSRGPLPADPPAGVPPGVPAPVAATGVRAAPAVIALPDTAVLPRGLPSAHDERGTCRRT